jgi:flagellar hook-associated protein 2
MTRVNIVTDGNESVVNEIEYFTDDEREEALEQLGIFRGDTTFMQLKNRLREIVMTPYETSAAERLSMLSQIGISSNSSGIGGGVDARRMRGYLEINESQLDEALNSDRLPAIKELFGTDSDQDLVVDTGVGYDIDQYTTYYVQTGGLIATRISGINQRIERTDNDIERMELSLEDKEQQLRIKYGQMESALGTMEENSRALENLNRSGQ